MITEAQRLMTDPKALAVRLRACRTTLTSEAADIIDPLGSEIERLRAALGWYADKENYTGQDFPDVLIDGGEIAREALAPLTDRGLV